MSIKINYLDTKISITDLETDYIFAFQEIDNELQDLKWEIFKTIDPSFYVDHEFIDTEYGNPIEADGGFIEEPLLIEINIIEINLHNSSLEIEFTAQIHFELFFELRGKTYDGTDRLWEYHGGSTERYFKDSIKIKGILNKRHYTDSNFNLVIEDENHIIYPELSNTATTTEMFEVDDQFILNLISESKFCPFTYFTQNLDLIQLEISDLKNITDRNLEFRKKVMLYPHIMSCFDAYLNVRLSKLALHSQQFNNRLKLYLTDLGLSNQNSISDKTFYNYNFLQRLLTKVFQIDISRYETQLKDFVTTRNHCVHRAGLDKTQKTISITHEYIQDTHNFIKDFSLSIEASLANSLK